MAHASPIRFSYDWRIHNHCGHSKQHIYVATKSRVQRLGVNLSSHTCQRDAWSVHILGSIRGLTPVKVSTRCNVLFCRCVLWPSGGNEVPILKSAAVFFTRSHGALQGSPLVKLIPAISIIAFASWGLGPLIRWGRVIFLGRTDSSWNKSSSYHVISSYIRPLLLWTGAILLCRSLEPVVLPSAASQAIKQRLLNFVRSLSTVLAFAYCFSSLIQQAQKFFLETHDSSGTRNMGFDFAGKAVYSAVWIAAVSLFMELLGFSTQKWVTAGGLGTVLLTLAGREIFTNFLSSVMIHATRPFVLNEWIQTKIDGYEVSGTVEHVGWWSPTIIRGDDREAVHIPNHKFTVNVVRNLSQKTHWRIKNYIAVSHLDVNKINYIVADMRKVLSKNPQVEHKKLHRRVFLENVDSENQGLMILISCFVKTSHFEEYLCVKEAILLDLLRVVSHHGARLATPIRTVQKIYGEVDLENVPFPDSMYSHSRGTINRQHLLIEPSYKINGEDRTRPSSPGRTSEDKEAQVEAASTSADEKTGSVSSLGSKTDEQATSTSSTKKSDVPASDDDTETRNPLSNDSSPEQDSTGDAEKKSNPVDSLEVLSPEESLKAHLSNPLAKSSVLERPSTSTLEENILLGVALDGSKRTLPIEEDMPLPESKELAANNSGGSSPKSKDSNDTGLTGGAAQ